MKMEKMNDRPLNPLKRSIKKLPWKINPKADWMNIINTTLSKIITSQKQGKKKQTKETVRNHDTPSVM